MTPGINSQLSLPSPYSQEHIAEPDIRQLIQALPTREDIQKLLGSLTGTLWEEIEAVRYKTGAVDHKLLHFGNSAICI